MYEDIRENIVKISRRAYDRGHVAACSGNISVRTPDEDGFVIKASGTSFADMGIDDLLFVDWQGDVFECDDMSPSARRPSIETAMHSGLYAAKGNRIRAVVHLHSPYTTAVSFLTGEIPLVVQEARLALKRVPVVANLPAGSNALAAAVKKIFLRWDISVAVMGEHGPVAIGESLNEAFCNVDMLEHNAYIATIMHQVKLVGRL